MTKTISLNNRRTALKNTPVILICIFLSALLITEFDLCRSSIKESLAICSQTLIPSMLPFMFIAVFITYSGILNSQSPLINKASYALSGMPYCALVIFILSSVGGYPVGAKMTKAAYEQGYITQNQANRLLLFAVNPSPAFVINAIGSSLFGSSKIGIIIYSSVIASNLIILFLSRVIDDKKRAVSLRTNETSLSSAFIKAGNEASVSMISICSYVVIFNCFLSLLTKRINNTAMESFIYGITEVTVGCQRLCELNNIPLIAGVVAWGGITVHLQIADCIRLTETPMKLFWTSRILSSALSVIMCDGLLKLFPIQVVAISQNNSIRLQMNETSFPVSVGMLLTCFLFLIGDYTVKNKKLR